MNDEDIVREFCTACENGDTKKLDALLAPEYKFEHKADGQTMDRREFLDMVQGMHQAVPDLRFNAEDIQGTNPTTANVQLSGTQEGTLVLPPGDRIEATGKSFRLPPEEAEWNIQGGKIVSHTVNKTQGGGFQGILEQLGTKVPVSR